MTDITLDRYLILGSAADRAAFTPDPGINPQGAYLLPIWVENDTGDAYYWDETAGPAAWVAWPSAGGGITELTGDVTAGPGSGSQAATIANSAVTLAKIANAAANDKLLGAGNAGSGAPYAEITLGSGLAMSGTTLNATGSGGTVTTTGSPANGNLTRFSGASSITNTDLTGDVTTSGGVATTVVNANLPATLTATGTPVATSIGYLGSPIDTSLDSGNAAPALIDGGKTFYHTDANARNFTIPANGAVAFPIGTILAIEQGPSAAAVSIIITTDTLQWGASTGTRTLAANGGCSIQKMSATVWRIRGEGIT